MDLCPLLSPETSGVLWIYVRYFLLTLVVFYGCVRCCLLTLVVFYGYVRCCLLTLVVFYGSMPVVVS